MSSTRTSYEIAEIPELVRRGPSRLQQLWRFCKVKPLGAIGGFVIAASILLAVLAPLVAPYDPLKVDYVNTFKPPGRQFFFGTDDFGRDILSRILWGSRLSLYVGFTAVALGATSGALLGLTSAYMGGKVDLIMQRFMDSLMAFPTLVLAIAIVAAIGASTTNAMLAIAIVMVPGACRTIRSNALSVKQTQYIEAARVIGCSMRRILLSHMLPNCVAPFIIFATAALGHAILTEATLSFLGLGTPPPEPSWGAMLSGAGRRYAEVAPWMAIFPGIAISLAVFGFNLLGDALRDVWDPRLRGG